MLIRRAHLERIATGEVSLAFRKWRKPTVKAGGTLRTGVGVLAIESVDIVKEASISAAQARASGYESRADLVAELRARRDGEVYRIRLRLAGSDPREQLREQANLTKDELAQIRQKLERLDSRSTSGSWTLAVMRKLGQQPGTRAAELAEQLGVEKAWLKVNIRKLKALGLTESLEIGYRLSPRGRVVLTEIQ